MMQRWYDIHPIAFCVLCFIAGAFAVLLMAWIWGV